MLSKQIFWTILIHFRFFLSNKNLRSWLCVCLFQYLHGLFPSMFYLHLKLGKISTMPEISSEQEEKSKSILYIKKLHLRIWTRYVKNNSNLKFCIMCMYVCVCVWFKDVNTPIDRYFGLESVLIHLFSYP